MKLNNAYLFYPVKHKLFVSNYLCTKHNMYWLKYVMISLKIL